jgi:hypothetical protein
MVSRQTLFALSFTALLRNIKCSHEQCSPNSKCSQETFYETEKIVCEHCSQTLFANIVRLGLYPPLLM